MIVPIASKAVGGFSVGFGIYEGDGECNLVLLLLEQPFVMFRNKSDCLSYLAKHNDLFNFANMVFNDPVIAMLLLTFDLE